MKKLTLLITTLFLSIGMAWAQEQPQIDYFENNSFAAATWTDNSGSWYNKVVTNTDPALTLKSDAGDGAYCMGWSTKDNVRRPWLKAGYSYQISLPEGYRITAYTLRTQSTSAHYSGTFTYTTDNGSAESEVQVVNTNKTVEVSGLSTQSLNLTVGGTAGNNNLGILITGLTVTYTSPVAAIGDVKYNTVAEALTAASAMTGDVTVEVYDKVTLNSSLAGSYSSINFVGKDTDAEIYLDVQGYITATGKKVSFTDLTLSKSQGGFITNAGFMNVAFGIYDVAEVTYTNCTFANGAYASSGNVTYNGCTFKRSWEKYGLWAYGNVDVTVEGSTFADYRGIKMYAEGAAKTVDLTVKSTDFSAVTDKPAIVLTYGESVTLEGNTYSSTGTFELDKDGDPNGTAVTSDAAPICKNDDGDCGVLVDGAIYTTVAQAVEVAAEGSNVTLLYSTTETAEFARGVNLTLADGVTAENITVDTPVYVAKVGTTEYETITAAIEASQAGSGKAVTIYAGTFDEEIKIASLSKNLIINGAANHGTVLTGGITIGTDDNKGDAYSVNISGIHFQGQGLKLVELRQVYVASNKFTGITGDAITVIGDQQTALSYVLENTIDGTTGAGINFRNPLQISVNNNVVSNTGHNAITIQQANNYQLKSDIIEIKDNTLSNWAQGESGEGRAMRIALGAADNVAKTVTISGNVMSHSGTPAEEYVKITAEAPKANVTVDNNYWGGNSPVDADVYLMSGTVESGKYPTNYYTDAAKSSLVEIEYAAQVGNVKYTDLQEAFKAATAGCTIDILADVTVDYNWDCRYTGSKFTVPVTINGNGHTLKFTNVVYDGGNHFAAFRFEADATVNNLTVDMTEAQSGFNGRFRAISSKANLTVNGCTFIGNGSANNTRAIIFGEGAGSNAANLVISVTDSNFEGWRRGISDNENAQDVKSVTVTGNTLKDAAVSVSANETVTFTGNTVEGAYVNIMSYTTGNTLNVTAKDNTLAANTDDAYNSIKAGGTVDAQDDFVVPAKGSNSFAYTKEVDGYVRVWGEGGGNAKKSYELKLYSGETLIATTKLNNVGGIIDGDVYVTWNFFYPESTDEYWTTTWEEGHPNSAAQPTEVELYIDGTLVSTTAAKMSGADDVNPVVWRNLGGVAVADLLGEGTAENPYLIETINDLKFFRDDVNTYTQDGSNQYKGKYVKLTADIDLAGENWEPIGKNSNGDHQNFLGTFYGEKADGTKPTISNLYINADGDHLGFFARVGSYAEGFTPTVKNIKFNNVNVSSNTTNGHGGSYVAGVIANAGGNSVVSGIEVTGSVYVVGYGYIGGIVGHGYPDIDNCHVAANDGSYIHSHYWCVGGIIGYAGEGGTPITNSSVSGVDIWSAYGGAAAVAGLLQDGNKLENVSASNVEITSNSDYCMGYIAGNGEASTMTNITVENVTATAKGNPITPTDAVAQVGDAIYFSFDDALNTATEGTTVKLLVDVALDEVVTIEKALTFDLNGKTVTGADGAIVFNIKAATTIKNGTVKGNKSGTSSGLIDIYANLAMDGVTVETSKINALRFKAGDCTATLDNCNITGAFKGYGGSVWVINSGTYKAASTAINDQLNGSAQVSGGTFHYEITDEECAPGYKVVANADGTYTVEYAPVCFVDANNNGTLDEGEVVYGSLEAVFNTIKEGDVYVVLTNNVTIASQVDTDADAKYYLNTNVAEGVTVDFAYADDWNYVQKMYVGKGVTLNAPYLLAWTDLEVHGTINTGYLYTTVANVVIAEGAVVNATTGDATVQVKNGATLTVNGELNTSTLNVWVGESKLIVSGKNAKVNAKWVDIWDGTPVVDVENGATLAVENIKASRGGSIEVADATLAATGTIELGHNGESVGTLTETGNSTIIGEIKLTVEGSTVKSDGGLTNVTTDLEGYKVVYENGEYKVVKITYVAKIGDVEYETLQDAENAAIDGDEIVLLGDIELNKAVTFFNAAGARMVTLNMNGKTITLENDYHVFYVCDGLTITGNGKIVAAPTEGYNWAHNFIVGYRKSGTTEGNAGNLVIENGTFYGNDASVVSVTNGSVTINGGSFESAGDMDLNCIDDMYAAGKAKITVKGGSFVGFNPENNASEGANTNFCADGYAALPDLNGNYVVGAKPTATVNNLGMTTVAAGDYMVYGSGDNTADMPLSFVMQFLADQTEEDMATSPYADWYGDFVITFTGLENGSFTADGCYLAGHYGSFGWVKVPVDGMTIEEGVRYPVMLGVGMGQKYDYICSSVQDFKCALYLTPEILAANPNIQVNLELGVVDNSKGSDAAASALVNNENVYSVTDYTYEAWDFEPNHVREYSIEDGKVEKFENDTEIEVRKLTYKRTLPAAGNWYPLYVPFEVPVEELTALGYEAAFFYDVHFEVLAGGEIDPTSAPDVHLIKIKEGTLKANFPYVIRANASADLNLSLVLENTTLFTTAASAMNSVESGSTINRFIFAGTYKKAKPEELTGDANVPCYAITNSGTLKKMSATASLSPFRVYMSIIAKDGSPIILNDVAAESIRMRVIGEENEDGTTFIYDVEMDGEHTSDYIYDLQGRRVLEPQKGGLYIVNGKKVVF